MTRAQYEQFCSQLFALALRIGLNPASRALGISEAKGRKISSRRKWQLNTLSPALANSIRENQQAVSQRVTDARIREVHERTLAHYADRSKIGFAIAATRASEHMADAPVAELLDRDKAMALNNHAKNAQIVHAWNVQQGTQVAVQVNVPLPTAEERAKRDELHKKLDAITARLNAPKS